MQESKNWKKGEKKGWIFFNLDIKWQWKPLGHTYWTFVLCFRLLEQFSYISCNGLRKLGLKTFHDFPPLSQIIPKVPGSGREGNPVPASIPGGRLLRLLFRSLHVRGRLQKWVSFYIFWLVVVLFSFGLGFFIFYFYFLVLLFVWDFWFLLLFLFFFFGVFFRWK